MAWIKECSNTSRDPWFNCSTDPERKTRYVKLLPGAPVRTIDAGHGIVLDINDTGQVCGLEVNDGMGYPGQSDHI